MHNSDYLIEQYTLEENDYKKIADLLSTSFLSDPAAIEEGASIQFSEQTIKLIFGSPTVKKNHFVRAIFNQTNEVVGFLGLIPRDFRIGKKTYKFAVPAWLAVHHQHRRKGLAKMMGKKMLEIAQQEDFDGGFALFEPEQHGFDTALSVAKEKNLSVHRPIETNKFIIRVFDSAKVASVVKLKFYEKFFFKLKEKNKKIKHKTNLRTFRTSDIPILYKLLENLTKDNHASIEANFEDFKWLLEQPITNCVIYEKNNIIKGFMLAWEFQLAGFGNAIPFGWIDIIHIKNLSVKEATDLSLYLSETSKAKGWFGLQAPYIPYFTSKPLQKANFVFFPKKLSFDIILLKKIKLPEKFNSVYFDWR